MPADSSGARIALRFLAAVREDRDLGERASRLDPAAGLDPVVELARSSGFEVDAEALRAAHRADWALRRARHAPSSAATTVAVVKNASSST